MYKKMIKNAAGVILSLSLAIASCGMTVNAQESKDKPSVTSNSLNAGGRVSKNQSGATATTTFSRPGNIRAKAIVYYRLGEDDYHSEDVKTNNAGGTTAFAEKKVSNANVVGAKGEHRVVYGDIIWNDETHIGLTLPNSKLK
ncbi:hypothetical protein D7V86_04760 [bacterium D16-51]|nr:hypothetical protein D7V96_05735 [bacterium D16-59]RKI61594.1 hypothetical protein D7V86_04760 [bacterium D16-51]